MASGSATITVCTVEEFESPKSLELPPRTTVHSFKRLFEEPVLVCGATPDWMDILDDALDLTSIPDMRVIVIPCDSAAVDPTDHTPEDYRWSGHFKDLKAQFQGEYELTKVGCSPVRPVSSPEVFAPLTVVGFTPPESLDYTDEQNDDLQSLCVSGFSPLQAVVAYESVGRNRKAALQRLSDKTEGT
jgi:hypothetical protein